MAAMLRFAKNRSFAISDCVAGGSQGVPYLPEAGAQIAEILHAGLLQAQLCVDSV